MEELQREAWVSLLLLQLLMLLSQWLTLHAR
jgi:hypothetical protein